MDTRLWLLLYAGTINSYFLTPLQLHCQTVGTTNYHGQCCTSVMFHSYTRTINDCDIHCTGLVVDKNKILDLSQNLNTAIIDM